MSSVNKDNFNDCHSRVCIFKTISFTSLLLNIKLNSKSIDESIKRPVSERPLNFQHNVLGGQGGLQECRYLEIESNSATWNSVNGNIGVRPFQPCLCCMLNLEERWELVTNLGCQTKWDAEQFYELPKFVDLVDPNLASQCVLDCLGYVCLQCVMSTCWTTIEEPNFSDTTTKRWFIRENWMEFCNLIELTHEDAQIPESILLVHERDETLLVHWWDGLGGGSKCPSIRLQSLVRLGCGQPGNKPSDTDRPVWNVLAGPYH